MNLFEQLVDQAVTNQQALAHLRPVVEKELLHHDILREMAEGGILAQLVFIGGTCLRACYGSSRLSEDLDFAGGAEFSAEKLQGFAKTLRENLHSKYGFEIEVTEPKKEGGNVSTWKIRIQTRPERKDLPAQRVNLDICAVPSHDPRPMMLRNPYALDMGTSGLILQAESREEILADKIIAFAFRPNRIKNRDMWDMLWLRQAGIEMPLHLIPRKIEDHHQTIGSFQESITGRLRELADSPEVAGDFGKEMRRFLPTALMDETVANLDFWPYLVSEVNELGRMVLKSITNPGGNGFKMG